MASEKYEIRGARPEDIRPACRMMYEAFSVANPKITQEDFERHYRCDPSFQPERLRLLWKDGRIVATTQVLLRTVYNGQEYLLMAGIGDVATHPDYRGQGLSVAILEDALRIVRSRGADYSMLYTGIRGLYERFGYRLHDRVTLTGRVPGRTARLEPSKDAGTARSLYEKSAGLLPGAFKRSSDYWKVWIEGFKLMDADIAYSPARDAYLIYKVESETNTVSVLDGGSDGGPGAIGSLVSSMFAGRKVKLFSTEESHLLFRGIKPLLVEPELSTVQHVMVLQVSGKPMPEAFCETIVDWF